MRSIKRFITSLSLALVLLPAGFENQNLKAEALPRQVNPLMGAIGRGHTVVGPQLPWGSINPSPDTEGGCSSGYNAQMKIRGFSQLHVTGTGSYGKYGQFLISPQIGLHLSETSHDSAKSEEQASISEYKVRLEDYNILCELSPTAHAAIYRFTFPQTDNAHILIDLGYNIPGNLFNAGASDEGEVTVDPKQQKIQGWGNYWGGWSSEPIRVHFAAVYSTPTVAFGTSVNDLAMPLADTQRVTRRGNRIGAYLRFNTVADQKILLKIALVRPESRA